MSTTLNQSLIICEVLRLLEIGGKNHEEIANELKVSRVYVDKIAKKYGYSKMKKTVTRNKYSWNSDDAYQIRKLHMQGVHKTILANQFNIPQRYVEYILADWVFPEATPTGWVAKPSKYPIETIKAIREEPDTLSHKEVAEKYGVSLSMVRVIRNKNWQ